MHDSGPNPSGRAVLEWDQAGKSPKAERESDPGLDGLDSLGGPRGWCKAGKRRKDPNTLKPCLHVFKR